GRRRRGGNQASVTVKPGRVLKCGLPMLTGTPRGRVAPPSFPRESLPPQELPRIPFLSTGTRRMEPRSAAPSPQGEDAGRKGGLVGYVRAPGSNQPEPGGAGGGAPRP